MRDLQERRSVVTAVKIARRLDRGRLLIPAVAVVVVVVDQVTKTWALHHLTDPRHVIGPINLILTYNSGAAFSLGQGITPIVETVVVGLVVWLLAISRRVSRTASMPVAAALGLLLGGALGNVGDRLFRHIPYHHGSVVDFIQAASWWPVFNVADSSIVIGVVLLVLLYARRGERHER